jgi:hypothetical protein
MRKQSALINNMCSTFLTVFITFYSLIYFGFNLGQTIILSFLAGAISIWISETLTILKKYYENY